ncbi:hypothetical protein H7849_25355 [Alloacidobacterium dinghuense]|uniref:Uncharacterized protein n=1 Tax=Alloacidobacterium dinghuense TaxID=2763107 RepID=A0A7G8BIA2_9BACT|nr:hypothetical protein [Alloacidobacterium dinghuense]QNI32272.1 hypothetical protein H7849_25355 [Alloacidobacterium dinghuense]
MATKSLTTGTAADLLAYQSFHHVSRNMERLTRVATADQQWIVRDWDGEVYCIKFEKNFSKKHLFTFSKDVDRTKTQAQAEAAKPGVRSDAENWHNAELELLKSKIAKNVDKRAVSTMCSCGHRFNQHALPGPACTVGGCGCAAFATPYKLARKYVGKPTEDPLSGASTTRNSCIILNWVPKAEFEDVVVRSIQAHEKPAGWAKGQPLAVTAAPPGSAAPAVAAATKALRWDFGLARSGAIVLAVRTAVGPPPVYNYSNFQGCWVKATKIGSEIGKQTWEIFHMESAPPHALF